MIKSPWEDDKQNNKEDFFHSRRNRPNFNNFNMPDLPNFDKKFFIYFGLILLIAWLSTGIYKVKEGEQAVILRFGRYNRMANPGLNYHLPIPIEKSLIEAVNKSRRVEIGYRSNSVMNYDSEPFAQESIMLTGDENIVDLNCDVVWHIKNLEHFLFNIASPKEAVKDAAESSIRDIIGETPIAAVLSNQKQEIAERIESLLQETLDSYGSGIKIEMVNLLKAEPPLEVIDAYRDVQTSRADKEREINQAIAYNNDVLPRARGEAAKILEGAEGYKQEVISKAKGDSERFLAIHKEYLMQKEITKDRLYLEAIENILKDSNKFIMGNETLPHLSIDKLKSVR